MKICIVSISFNPDLGGVVYDVARELLRRGHSISVFTGGGTLPQGEWVELGEFRLFRAYTFDVPWKLRSFVCVRNPVVERQWKLFLKEVEPDVVHINQLYYRFPYSFVRIAKKYVTRVYVTAHDVNAFSDKKLTTIVERGRNPKDPDSRYHYAWYTRLKDTGFGFNPLRNCLIRRYLQSATRIFAVSDALKRAFNENGIRNVVTLHNGIGIEEWSSERNKEEAKHVLGLENRKVILTVGRLSGEKGRKPLFESFERVKQAIPSAVLVLIGDDIGDRWSQEIAQRKLEKSVMNVGFVSRSDLPLWYAASDVVVVPSVCFDSFPTINLEAMAAGRPVLATCYGGSREVVVDGATGYIVNPLDTNTLASAISQVCSDDIVAKRFGQAGLERVSKEFRLNQQVDVLERHYRE